MFPSWRIAILLFSAGCLVLLLAPESAVQPEKAMVQRAMSVCLESETGRLVVFEPLHGFGHCRLSLES